MDINEWPDVGDFVVCTVKDVVDFGAYTTLEEYGGKEGFIHISEIKAGWVKYVRDYVREGQKIVCKVLKVDTGRRHIDLSLKDVNEHQKRAKIQDWKNEQKAAKWLQFVEEETKIKDEELDKLKIKLHENFGSLHSAFEEAAINGEAPFIEMKIKKNVVKSILRIAQENIKLPFVDIAGFVDLNCYLPEGIEVIKRSLMSANEIQKEGVKVEITYTGAPRYRIKVIAPDYKTAESVLKNASNAVITTIHKLGGQGVYHRHNESVKA
ncbi:MAG: Translation initiation factor 2 subunit alpha [Methanomethylovorans sp. PtaU1.Bin093]|uniref:translation initiation factor IF-2 subunit alpha n=1 Tax=Methanomethylovorans sp. PtaU1.Bin093 TaxID=1811679 RepID=UPI0009C677B8|nr:translation initiation factor IF-2 subunit alpha [Methanomethylovorans sp. PtaU1.Bin093]OPY20659.1 MAG: Translation initiation factor 2 subunit alpha [Methanomethylovorans sp. PtaU1.Bin093]